jgi:hypothetical protein
MVMWTFDKLEQWLSMRELGENYVTEARCINILSWRACAERERGNQSRDPCIP